MRWIGITSLAEDFKSFVGQLCSVLIGSLEVARFRASGRFAQSLSKLFQRYGYQAASVMGLFRDH